MTCRWCGNDNVLNRPHCPHCGENVKRLEEAFATEREDPEESSIESWRYNTAQVGKSLAVSAIAVVLLVGGGKAAYSEWPETMWPRSLSSRPPAAAGNTAAPTEGASERCVNKGARVVDPNGRSYHRWYCTIERPGHVLGSPSALAAATGYLREGESWFACQVQGAPDPEGGGTTWFYTQGDEQYADEGWGYFPAGSVDSSWNNAPVPGLPLC
ncbi:hypothetical protein [Actinomadura sp. WMMA1423]|uniref:hypothetical protein n=1 Tax=Actinomadura sp. WMMA1423 TaxID=2591108 RepID=UPI001146E6DC|nr:hypothetical protein [Actinomadura sp. WMMA1423]